MNTRCSAAVRPTRLKIAARHSADDVLQNDALIARSLSDGRTSAGLPSVGNSGSTASPVESPAQSSYQDRASRRWVAGQTRTSNLSRSDSVAAGAPSGFDP